ncbi:MAG: DedA family protein [Candidatus Saccharimonadales bacterium]
MVIHNNHMLQASQHIPSVIQALSPIVGQYGYLGVGGLITLEDFGVPAPGETVLIAAAFFAGLGHLNIIYVFLAGFLGAVVGDNIGFAIGEYGGRPLVERFGRYVFLTPDRLDKAEAFFNRHGGKVIILARFVAGLRQINGIIAGLSNMRWLKFVTYNIIGAALWVAVWSAVGYLGGSHISTFLHYQLYASITAFVSLLVFILFKFIRHKKSNLA